MKKILIIITLLLTFILLNSNDISYKIPQVLVIQSYHSGFLWTDNINTSIKRTLKQYDNNTRITTEFLDTKRFTSQQFKDDLKLMLEYKYKDSAFDVVIVADNNAFEMVKELNDTVFKRTPIVFCGLNFFDLSQLGSMKNVTGVREENDFLKNFELIKKIHKNVEKIIVINDLTPTGYQNKLNINKDIRNFKDDVEIEIVEDISVAELKEKLRNLSPNTVVLYSYFFKDNQDRFLEYDESILIVAEASVVPVYITTDFSLGYGTVGGYLTSGALQGENAANLAIQILNGVKADKLNVIDVSPNNYYFDYNVLQKWGIKLSDLPANSEIINYEESYFSSHKRLILRFSFLIFVLFVIISWLIITLIRKNRLKNDLQTSNQSLINLKQNLEVIVKDRTNELEEERNFIRTVQDHEDSLVIVFDEEARINRANRCAITNLEFDADTIEGQSLWQLFEDDSDIALIQNYIENSEIDKSNLIKQFKIISYKGNNLIVDSAITSISPKGEKYFIMTGTNVTEKHSLFMKLEREEKKYRSVYENSGIAMVTFAESNHVTMINKKFEELSGYSRDEVINKMTWRDLVDPSSLNLIQTNKDLRIQNKIPQTDNYEIKLVNKKGFVLDVIINVVLVAETKELISTITDITAKNTVQNKMKTLLEEQKAFNEGKNNFYKNLGQDLSTPINTIHGILDLVKYSQDSKEVETYLKVLQGLTRQLSYMVNEMTNYEIAYSPKELNIQKSDLPTIIKDATNLLLSRANIAKILFTLDSSLHDEIYLAVDCLEKLLQIIIINLAKNYPDNPILISVTELDESYLKVVVKRGNLGFKDVNYTEVMCEKMEKIYKLEYISPFGFNYYVISALISLMGGKLELDNNKNSEYKFTIKKLKKEDVKENDYHTKVVNRIESLLLPMFTNENKQINRENIYPLKVLLVNYNNVEHYALHKILDILNQKIDVCLPEQDLKEIISKTTYDVIIFDFSRMSINNLDTLKDIREMKNIYQPFIIASKLCHVINEYEEVLGLINNQLPEITNIIDIAGLIQQATEFKNKKI